MHKKWNLWLVGLALIFGLNAFSSEALAQVQISEIQYFNHSVIPQNAVRIPLVQFTLSNNSDQVVQLNEASIYRYGLNAASDFGNIWIESSKGVSSVKTGLPYLPDFKIRFNRPIILNRAESETFTMYINKVSTGENNRTLRFQIKALDLTKAESKPVVVREKKVINANRRNYRNYGSRTNRSRLWNSRYNPGARDVVFMSQAVSSKIERTAETVRVFVSSSSQIGDLNNDGLKNVEDLERVFREVALYQNGQKISRRPGFIEVNGQMVLEFNYGEIIERQNQFEVIGDFSRMVPSGTKVRLYLHSRNSFTGV